ncbi:MAG TPA: hypothetical protein VFE62_07710 [Gemmataceae bacterium]|nr:hypothetical protein [Gemmataceae bacterium]
MNRTLAVVFVSLFFAATARADLILSETGSTHPQHAPAGSGTDAIVSVAVFDRTNGVPGDSYHTGIANFDSTLNASFTHGASGTASNQSYLYLYQITNMSNGYQVTNVNLPAFLPGIIAGILPNNFTFSPSPIVPGAAPGDQAVFVTGATTLSNSGSGLQAPFLVDLTSPNVLGVDFISGTQLNPGVTSVIIGFTSDLPPNSSATVGVLTNASSGGATADGTLPSNGPSTVPEPASFAIWGGLVAAGAWYGRRRLKLQQK